MHGYEQRTMNYRLYSTNVECSLQIHTFFLQNEPDFQKSQMNVSVLLTMGYVKMDTWCSGKNEPKTNPISAQKLPKRSQNEPNLNLSKANFIRPIYSGKGQNPES